MFSYKKYEECRNRKHMTNQDVSYATRLCPATFTNWKQGKYTPKIDKLEKIAEAIGVTANDFRETA